MHANTIESSVRPFQTDLNIVADQEDGSRGGAEGAERMKLGLFLRLLRASA
jgi:hypothetical protein